ncbi:MarR family transcriptional regulator [Kribbella sp. NPDC051770]|uniref:MarR family transcriptional regulator n=1 Tax=Kribbella sp. NPDC051770 TaxID=3155413 RepID=UPI0034179421
MYMSEDNKPIGWWLKELDRLIEAGFAEVLAADGLDRRQWQALNAAGGDQPVAAALAPFEGSADAVRALEARGWMAGEELTDEGRAVRERLTGKVGAYRRQVADGIEPGEYAATVAVLRRMALNLTGRTNSSAV